MAAVSTSRLFHLAKACFLIGFGFLVSATGAEVDSKTGNDPPSSAVIPLEIPLTRRIDGRRAHVREDCTGTLVDSQQGLIITAWHCFDGTLDLTRLPRAYIGGAWVDLRLGASGGDMSEDWALVYIAQPPLAQAPTLSPSFESPQIGDAVTMLGYSRSLRGDTPVLRALVEDHCVVIGHNPPWVQTNCQLSQGTSGGAVVTGDNAGRRLVGIISAQKSGAGVLYIPLTRFRHRLSPP